MSDALPCAVKWCVALARPDDVFCAVHAKNRNCKPRTDEPDTRWCIVPKGWPAEPGVMLPKVRV